MGRDVQGETMLKIRTTPTPYWTQVIEEAPGRRLRGLSAFTKEHRAKAASWVTCACGKQDSKIPRNSSGVPYDNELDDLGSMFYAHIETNSIRSAEETLARIELRAAQVMLEHRL